MASEKSQLPLRFTPKVFPSVANIYVWAGQNCDGGKEASVWFTESSVQAFRASQYDGLTSYFLLPQEAGSLRGSALDRPNLDIRAKAKVPG